MRLNKYHKDAFVESVLQDLPSTDYDEIAQKLVRESLVEKMPAKVRAVYDDKDVRQWLRNDWVQMPGNLQNFYCISNLNTCKISEELEERLFELSQLKREQSSKKAAFKSKLEAAINSCQTRKQALELLPEFEKYLPKDTSSTGVSNLPAVCNLVAELVQAGWPKEKESA